MRICLARWRSGTALTGSPGMDLPTSLTRHRSPTAPSGLIRKPPKRWWSHGHEAGTLTRIVSASIRALSAPIRGTNHRLGPHSELPGAPGRGSFPMSAPLPPSLQTLVPPKYILKAQEIAECHYN